MSRYKIVEILACNSQDEFVSRYYHHDAEKKVYEVWVFKKFKFLWYQSEDWDLVDISHTLDEAKDEILRLKGEHPDQIKRKELKKEQPKVVYEE